MARNFMRIAGALLGLILIVGLALLGLVYLQGIRIPTGAPVYVAMGSSYASGPGLASKAPDSPILCGRSDNNYAHILARQRKLSLVDVSCAGATTTNVIHGGQYFQRAQVDAISAQTRLVTVTIGGNDVFYLGNLAALGCGQPRSLPSRVLSSCRPVADILVMRAFAGLDHSLRAVSSEVHRRAPKARLLFVNYLTVLPASGTCLRLGLSDADANRMRVVAAKLANATKTAANASGAEVVDVADLSRDHNVCSGAPWLNGRHPPGLLIAPLHPNAAGMHAVAAAIDKVLSRSSMP